MDNLDNEVIHKAGSVSFQSGSNTLNYSYMPSESANENSTIAYEYMFGNSMDRVAAVNLKSIDTTNVTIRYAYSPTKLSEEDEIISYNIFSLQTLASKGDRVYIYLLVTPTNESVPTTFTSSIRWYFGIPQTVTVSSNVDDSTTSQIIVSGQEVDDNTFKIPAAPEGYYFDALYLDRNYEYLGKNEDCVNTKVYARFANLPSDYIAYDTAKSVYYVKRGSSALPNNLIIPAKYDDGINGKLSVTYIADGVSYSSGVFYNKSIVSASLPCTLTEIGACAFQETNSLTTVNIPEGVTHIGKYAFYTSKINSIYIPKSVVSLGSGVFSGCYNLPSIDVSQGNLHYTSIDGVLYSKNKKALINYPAGKELDVFKVPSSVITVGGYAFKDAKLTKVILPEGITSINSNAFLSSKLVEINIPSTVTSIIGNPFGGCPNLNTITIDNNSNFVIENNILYDGDKDTAITAIGNYSTYTIASTVTTLSYMIFSCKSNLTHLTIPASTIKISRYICRESNNIQSIIFEDTSNWKDSSGNIIDVSNSSTNAIYFKLNDELTKN